jgi:hypothetical protein
MVMNYEFERLWKEAAVVYFKVLSQLWLKKTMKILVKITGFWFEIQTCDILKMKQEC